MADNHNGSTGLGVIIGILTVIFLTSAAVAILLSGTWLYGIEIDLLNISEISGFSREFILDNYRAVIQFLSPFYSGEFLMPDLPASVGGAQHFEEVKSIVTGLYIAGIISVFVMAVIALAVNKKIGKRSYLAASVSALALPLAIILGIIIDFDGFFILFHKIFFNNSFWIFYPDTDPVITILPSEYFMHCAIIIALFWILGSFLFFLKYKKFKKQNLSKPVSKSNALSFDK